MTQPDTSDSLRITVHGASLGRGAEVFVGPPAAPGIVTLQLDRWVNLTPFDARRLADALQRCADRAEQ